MDWASRNSVGDNTTEAAYGNSMRKNYLGISCDDISIGQALSFMDSERSRRFISIVTPNVDHILKLNSSSYEELNTSYSRATLILNDSRVVKLLSRIFKLGITNVVTGSDLVEQMVNRERNQHILLVGPTNRATDKLRLSFPTCTFENICPDTTALSNIQRHELLELAAQPRFSVILFCMGCPVSEELLSRTADRRTFGIGISCGAAVDFLTGKQNRAPKLLQALAMEWLFRAFSQPSRLGKRYLCNLVQLPVLLSKLIISQGLYSNQSW